LPGLPSKCPNCGSTKEYEWGLSTYTDFGSEQEATCTKCKKVFTEISEPVDWEYKNDT
jgi:DNA-directed RNA polymerase subunit M/transcription elongation factor TFIIS